MYTNDQKLEILKVELLFHKDVETVYFNENSDWTFDKSNVGFEQEKSRYEILGTDKPQDPEVVTDESDTTTKEESELQADPQEKQNLKTKKTN